MKTCSHLIVVLLVLSVSCNTSCKKYDADKEPPVSVQSQYPEVILVFAIDLSGSFFDTLATKGKAYDFLLKVMDRYFVSSIGSNHRVVIAQLSGDKKRAPIWDGTPAELRKQFKGPEYFLGFLYQNRDTSGSRLHDGIADVCAHVLDNEGVRTGRTKCAVIVLSDMEDNLSGPGSEERLAQTFKELGKINAAVGMYYVTFELCPKWRQHLRESGVKHWVVEPSIVAQPEIPSIE